ncbi:flagellar basal body-associated FliL family protein [Teredinibacter turnerae]|uniref:Flagellar protein FliL n=1 Tax=Teredinibacter turnerae (strain ATCC 39867 / T7901) TaxID=377629 RepID=C5BLN6_TERTT|nr:flagellar basal body-associated FliL family protein [Teredinibacter turnerae]ACR11177.1 flagellar basal body-associated protein FliL [Teredinibacter turnerae T7901]
MLPCLSWAQDDGEEAAEEPAAAEEGEEGVPSSSAIYLPIKPAFVVNFGGPGKLRYIKAEVSVRVDSSDAANSVRHHLPYIRNNLVMLFASQTEDTVDSQAGKEALRQDALAEVRKILFEEDGLETGVVDIFFNTLIVQR